MVKCVFCARDLLKVSFCARDLLKVSQTDLGGNIKEKLFYYCPKCHAYWRR